MKIDKYPLKKYNGFYGVVLIQLKKRNDTPQKREVSQKYAP